MEKLAGIQIARAIAALAVAYFHSKFLLVFFPEGTAYPATYLISYGFYGVDLFFAISGFVLCVVASKSTFTVAEFATKRVFRIYPLWIAACFLYWATIQKFAVADIDYVVRSFALLPTEKLPVLDVGWTLQHEIAFYALGALLVPMLRLPGVALFLLAGAMASHFIALPWWAAFLAKFYLVFLAGMIAYWLHDKAWVRSIGWKLPLALGAMAFWCCTMYLANPRTLMPAALVLLVIGFANMVVSSRLRWAVVLGDASYSIYLMHAVVFAWIYEVFRYVPVPPTWTQEFIRFSSIALVCAISVLTWRYFEEPINRYARRLATRKTTSFGATSVASRTKSRWVSDLSN